MRSGVLPGSNGPGSSTRGPSATVRGDEPGSTVTPCAPRGRSTTIGAGGSTGTWAGLRRSKT